MSATNGTETPVMIARRIFGAGLAAAQARPTSLIEIPGRQEPKVELTRSQWIAISEEVAQAFAGVLEGFASAAETAYVAGRMVEWYRGTGWPGVQLVPVDHFTIRRGEDGETILTDLGRTPGRIERR